MVDVVSETRVGRRDTLVHRASSPLLAILNSILTLKGMEQNATLARSISNKHSILDLASRSNYTNMTAACVARYEVLL